MIQKFITRTVLVLSFLSITIPVQAVRAQETPPSANKPAYFVAEFWLEDAEAIKPYSAQVPATLEPYGGRFIVRGGQMDELEGEPPHNARMIVIAFDTMKKAQEWYHSQAYQKIIPLRKKAGKTNVYIIEGLSE